MRVGLMGCGHMGRLHARTLERSAWSQLAWVCDVDPAAARALGERYEVPWSTVDPGTADLVLVATPATTHQPIVTSVLRSGRWCFVEKPLAVDAALPDQGHDRLIVGHSERFNPAWRAGVHLLGDDVEVIRQGPRTGRNEDVDAVLDLMVHDLDLLLQREPGEVEVLAARGDAHQCEVQLRTSRGVAKLRAHRGASSVQRSWSSGHVLLDLARQAVAVGSRPTPIERWDILEAQWSAVGSKIHGQSSSVASANESVRVLQLAADIRRALAS